MTFTQITERRVQLAEQERVRVIVVTDLPEFQQARIQQNVYGAEENGVVYQKCGGGRRVMRTKGGAS